MSGVGKQTRVNPPWVEFLEGSLAQVETVLRSEAESSIRTITGICERSISAGGKRFRPALVILGALASDPEGDISRAVRLGAGVELLHLGTLMHDDVIDGSDSRRGQASANALYGNKVSVLIGDYLLSRSFCIMARDGDQKIIRKMGDVTVALSEGEVLELIMRGSLGELESLYWKMIDRKTARLISACLEVGGISVNAKSEYCEILASYGERIGLVFQITDDLLDLVSSSDTAGKPVGADLRDGKVTLPYILALRQVGAEVQESLLQKIFESELEEEDICFITDLAMDEGIPELCLELASEQVEIANKHLSKLPATPAKCILEEVGTYLLRRNS